MLQIVTINYICPHCGYTWDDSFRMVANLSPLATCASCEEPVVGLLSDR